MTSYYLDTSALVKLYVQEPGTDRMRGLITDGEAHQLAVLASSKAEFHSGVRRRERSGDLYTQDAHNVLYAFDRHLETLFHRQEVSIPVIDLATLLVARHPLRAYDAMQLAGFIVYRTGVNSPTVFTCSDRALLRAADAEGLVCFDPTS